MKRILIVCLLGMGLLLPTTTITAKEEFRAKRVIDVYQESDILSITSDASSGTLVQVNIYNSQEQKVMGQGLSGYASYVDVSSLPNGTYRAHVAATAGNYTEYFTLN